MSAGWGVNSPRGLPVPPPFSVLGLGTLVSRTRSRDGAGVALALSPLRAEPTPPLPPASQGHGALLSCPPLTSLPSALALALTKVDVVVGAAAES